MGSKQKETKAAKTLFSSGEREPLLSLLSSVRKRVFGGPVGRAMPIRVIRAIRGWILFRREGGDDFFEARITAQRVPERIQF